MAGQGHIAGYPSDLDSVCVAAVSLREGTHSESSISFLRTLGLFPGGIWCPPIIMHGCPLVWSGVAMFLSRPVQGVNSVTVSPPSLWRCFPYGGVFLVEAVSLWRCFPSVGIRCRFPPAWFTDFVR